MKQYLFYQHNVQQFFIRHLDKFDGVVVPLSIATSFPDGTHGFLQALFAKDQHKQFLIDPRSPLFQKQWNREYVRPPHEKMANIFGSPFTTKGLTSNIDINDLPDDVLLAVTGSIIDYQNKFRLRKQEQKKIDKYKKLLGVADLPQINNPQLFVPPYFAFSKINDPWYNTSIKCVEYACAIDRMAANIRPILHFDSFDNIPDWSAPINQLKTLGISSVFLYPNYFREHSATNSQLTGYRHAVTSFSSAGIEPYALHGGYFAITLAKLGLCGFGNGVGYGEWRDSGYHRGGTAEKRIYILKLHRFLEPSKAQALINSDPEYFASDTDLLAECVASKRPLDGLSLEEALDHFMDCRKQEIDFVTASELSAIQDELTMTVTALGKLGELQKEYATSLNVWRDVLGIR